MAGFKTGKIDGNSQQRLFSWYIKLSYFKRLLAFYTSPFLGCFAEYQRSTFPWKGEALNAHDLPETNDCIVSIHFLYSTMMISCQIC